MSIAVQSQKYLMFAHVGALALGASVAAQAFGAPDFYKGLTLGMLLALVALLFRSKMRDEYIERLWNAGTAAAFLAALVVTVGVELVRGFGNPAADVFAVPPMFDTLEVGSIVLAAFFIAFHVAMLRSRS